MKPFLCIAAMLMPAFLLSQNCQVSIAGGHCVGNLLTAQTTDDVYQLVWRSSNNTVFYADTVRTTTSVSIVAGNRGSGTAYNQFGFPTGGIFVDKNLNIYVADSKNHRVMKWAPGAFAGTLVAGGHGQGSAANQLYYPKDVFVDSLGNVYVADTNNDRIQKWAPGATSGVTVAGGKGLGPAPNQLHGPNGLYVDEKGNIYIADTHNYRVQRWEPGATRGVTVAGGTWGIGDDQFELPVDVYLDGAKNIYVADAASDEAQYHRIMKWARGAKTGVVVAGGNGSGSAANQFNYITSLYVDKAGNIYVNDVGNRRVQQWIPGAQNGITVAGGYGIGSNPYQLYYGTGLTIGADNALYVLDGANYAVKRFVITYGVVNTNFTPRDEAVYTVEARFKNGCTAISEPFRIYNNPRPQIQVTPGSIRGNLCNGGRDTFYIESLDDISTFTWKVPKSTSVVYSNEDSLVLDIPAGFKNGTVVLNSKNYCGVGIADTVRLYGKPLLPSRIAGRRYVKANTAGVVYSIKDLGYTYHWSVSPGATITSGQNTASVTVDWGTEPGEVAVDATNECGTSATRSKAVQVWKRKTAAARQPVEMVRTPTVLSVYPNPVTVRTTLSFFNKTQEQGIIELADVTGRVLLIQKVTLLAGKNLIPVDLSPYVHGTYLISLSSKSEGKKTLKVLKQ